MHTPANVENCLSFLHCYLQPKTGQERPAFPKLAVTISRESGCGAHAIAEKLAAVLQAAAPKETSPWNIFDQNLMERVLAEHHLPESISKYMPEDRVTEISDIMDEVFGLRPGSWTLVEQTSETVLRLAELGNVIIIGRAGNVVTARLPHVLHVRLIAPLEDRIANHQHYEGLTRAAAVERISQQDTGRRRYLKKYFGKDVADPLLYHIVINTSLVTIDAAVQLIACALQRCCLVQAVRKLGTTQTLHPV